jgi:xylose isomerase
MASEDIGLADPRGLQLALQAAEVYERLGSPEGELAIAQAVVYLAVAPKSNAVYAAWNAARDLVRRDGTRPVPERLRNAPTRLMKDLGFGAGYRYAHDEDGAFAAGERYLPDGLSDLRFYEPVSRGLEIRIGERLAERMQASGTRLLWGTANLFSNRRYMAGAATNPDPEVFAYAAAQVKNALELTHELGGENYVLWGGREGYETLLNTDLKRELAQLGRFLTLVVEHKHKIGFKGAILIEPKPAEPTKHQYDFDVATVFGFLKAHGLDKEVKVNIEQNHALLAGHTFEHELSLAQALGIFGSVDMNRGDELLGWDTDQFPNNLPQLALAMYTIVSGGGFTTGGLNFDAKLRRQSIDPDDLVAGHAGAMDLCARALLVAEAMLQDGALKDHVEARYAGWDGPLGRSILKGKKSLDDLARLVDARSLEPQPRSGQQERLEALVNGYL